ncbi:hypothetical protein FY030_04360 [Ornithinimicrobium pratense]|uniref:Uncharacterized protein n=1 Tax=Ornithinimicrobium pratense TaxID=2593973 RepID=A0A5J6V4W5_9MICO|nr:hypothetical protein FY030_04360 [Ornithinimicrobium pratense]
MAPPWAATAPRPPPLAPVPRPPPLGPAAPLPAPPSSASPSPWGRTRRCRPTWSAPAWTRAGRSEGQAMAAG